MKITVTKFVHSCLLVQTPDRTALFDPGSMSQEALDLSAINQLDDIFITHIHGDHLSPELLAKVLAKFPQARITSTPEVVEQLAGLGITASTEPPTGVSLFTSPHEDVQPIASQPQNIGIDFLGVLSNPGDSHSFDNSLPILALPMTAPWGATTRAINLALELRPKFVLPIHDWHWNDQARQSMYNLIEPILAKEGITFVKLQTGQPVDLSV